MRKIVIADIDGTVALRGDRSPYDWEKVGEDKPNTRVIEALMSHARSGYEIHFVSGRMRCCMDTTLNWLTENIKYGKTRIPFRALHMRNNGDSRKDTTVKKEIFEKYYASGFYGPDAEVAFIYDDRDSVVAMWRSLGLTCFQVA